MGRAASETASPLLIAMKDYAKSFYKSKRWQHTREAYLRSVGMLCERCAKKGLMKPAEIVHHKVWITPENINDPNVVLNFHNLEAVCRECHAEEHDYSKKRWKVDEFGRVTVKDDPPQVQIPA